MKTIYSNNLTFMDTTDSRKVTIYIAANLPTTQIYNPNTGVYSPDWTKTPLNLVPTVYLDSVDITANVSIQWTRKYGTGTADAVSGNKILTVSRNELSHESGIVTYSCSTTYRGLSASAQLVFVRSDVGANGVAGADGTSVTILGVAYAKTAMVVGNYYTLYTDGAFSTEIPTTTLQSGDSYIVSGYLCVYNTAQRKFLCTGKIQGPKGEDGSDASQIILTSTSQIIKIDKNGTYSPAVITVTGTAVHTTITSWLYSVDGGKNYYSTANGVTRNGNTVTITGSQMTANSVSVKASDGLYSDIITIYKVLDGTDGSSGDDGVPAPVAFLTNESISFAANANGQIPMQNTTFNVVSYMGAEKITPTIGTITGLPSGMTIDASKITTAMNELIIPIMVADKADFGSSGSISGVLTIPILTPVSTNLKLNWSKINSGADGIDGVTFKIYAPDGYLLSRTLPSITLQTFAYDGENAVSNAVYQWYEYIDTTWQTVVSATGNSLTVDKDRILKSKSYKCDMTYKGVVYSDTVTVQDKTDEYNAVMQVSSNPTTSLTSYYWIMYPVVYSEHLETDDLLGQVSKNAPVDAVNGDYWYAVDTDLLTVTLKRYDGAAWIDSTDEQEYIYDWSMIGGDNQRSILPGVGKVRIIKAEDFTGTSTFECRVSNDADGLLAVCSVVLTDVSDPIVSETRPENPKHGQLWLKNNPTDNTFLLFMYDGGSNNWIAANADEKQVIYTVKPSSYRAGDLWIVEADGAHGQYLKGTLLQATASSTSYADADWTVTLKYDQDLGKIKETLDKYSEIMQVTDKGLKMAAVSATGEISKFSALFSSEELCFYEGNEKILRLINNKLIAPRIETGNATISGTLSIGAFQFIIESNNSMSLVINK